MSWLDDTLAEFGGRIGVPDLAFGPGGFVQIALGQGGMLGIAQSDGGVMQVWLTRPVERAQRAALERGLVECDFRRGQPFPMQAALHGDDGLVLLARIPERAFTTPALEQVLDALTRVHERVRYG
jgi:type III secretion system chaperone SycN